ncbi:LysE family translocator [Shewanella sp. 10N.286.54.B9]|uniref:LysE family translocator n=1 Tax=Shewanella sp. 10N.286.54.B9 TaxID=3229719 RepID=UPI00354E3A91
MQFENWFMFCSIALLATATPGPAALVVSINSLSFGFKKSLITILGNVTGLFIMSTFSVLGLSAVVLHSTMAFTVIKIFGAAYLVYLGFKLWVNGVGNIEVGSTKTAKCSSLNLYTQGVLVALTNPKAVIFTTALFPQFIVANDPLMYQFSILVLSFMLLSFFCLSSYALVAQRAKSRTINTQVQNLLGKIFGTTFIGAGCMLAATSE